MMKLIKEEKLLKLNTIFYNAVFIPLNNVILQIIKNNVKNYKPINTNYEKSICVHHNNHYWDRGKSRDSRNKKLLQYQQSY